MTILGCCEWCLGGSLAIVGLLTALRLGWVAHHRPPARHYRVGYDATHPLPNVTPRRLAPEEYDAHFRTVKGIWNPNPMRETLIVARPLGWDAQPRKEY